jgi:hypothetical protein
MKHKFIKKPHLLGSGAFCKVYESTNNTVNKIYHKSESNIARTLCGYRLQCVYDFNWMSFLPAFNSCTYKNHHYIFNQPRYSELNDLYPAPEDMYDNFGMYTKITEHAYGILQPKIQIPDISEFLHDFEFYEEFKTLEYDEQRTYMYFIECILNLFEIGEIYDYHWDLHTKNLMYDTTNNQLIIVDPWC